MTTVVIAHGTFILILALGALNVEPQAFVMAGAHEVVTFGNVRTFSICWACEFIIAWICEECNTQNRDAHGTAFQEVFSTFNS